MTSKLLIITDLDGSLLDEKYRWDEAQPSLARIRKAGIPLILNSSKTLAEIIPLAEALETTAPLIAENGGVLAIRTGSELDTGTGEIEGAYRVSYSGIDRKTILAAAHALRESEAYAFAGFADWSDQEISDRTGLGLEAAHLAGMRLATEPILWNDTDATWEMFCSQIEAKNIRAIRGGRFIHLMGPSDKAEGVRKVRAAYEHACPSTAWTTVALGDSPNDRAMLEAVDVAVVIPHANGQHMEISGPHVHRVPLPGPAGWHIGMQTILDKSEAIIKD